MFTASHQATNELRSCLAWLNTESCAVHQIIINRILEALLQLFKGCSLEGNLVSLEKQATVKITSIGLKSEVTQNAFIF